MFSSLKNNFIIKKMIFLIIFLICIIIVRQSGYLQNIEIILNRFGEYTPIAYIVILSIASNLFIPVSVLIITGGLLFGSVNGFFYSFIGGSLSILLGYLLFKQLTIKNSKNMNGRIGLLYYRIQNRGLIAVLIIRLIAIPFTAQNILSSILNISFKTYLIGSLIGITPWLIGFSYFGGSIVRMKYHLIILSGILLIVLYWIALRLAKNPEIE